MELDRKIRVGAVSYLNSKPLVYGLQNLPIKDKIDLGFEYPSKLADQLAAGEIDIALVPVASITALRECHIITDYCIGADKAVVSVCLFSDVPMEHIKKVYLDYQSRTSVALVKILMKEYWKVSPETVPAKTGYEEKISGAAAGLVIGDRALVQHHLHNHVYDLAEAWIAFTGLPFVFATWVANKKLPAAFLQGFNAATGYGLSHIPEIASKINFPYDLEKYYTEDLNFNLDARKRKGLNLFLEKLKTV